MDTSPRENFHEEIKALRQTIQDLDHRIQDLRQDWIDWQADHIADCEELLRRLSERELPLDIYEKVAAAIAAQEEEDEAKRKRQPRRFRTFGRRNGGDS